MSTRIPHPELARNLALIGGRGCGKSSIAKRLARANRNFMLLSLDMLVRYEADARTIPEIVEQEGWRGFRDREYTVVQRAAAFPGGALIDCGGGVVVDLDEADREIFSERKVKALRRNALVVYLARDVDYLVSRIADDPARPDLSDTESFRDIMARRDPWYREAADLVLECGHRAKTELAREILAWYYTELGVGPGPSGPALP